MIFMNDRSYFLGGASPGGFRTPADRIIYGKDCYTYIIKGTAGSGKSTLLKKIAAAFPDEEKDIYYCSADPDSLDAVHLRKKGIMVIDGTAPHVFEPVYPFAAQSLVDLGAYLDSGALLEQREDIIKRSDEYTACHVRCRRYLTALAAILSDMKHIGGSALMRDKLEGFTSRICRRLMHGKIGSERGKIFRKQLSAITPRGYVTMPVDGFECYIIGDELFCGADIFLRKAAEYAADHGYETIVGESYLHTDPIIESLLIPEINTAFLTGGAIPSQRSENDTVINFRRFYDKKILAEKKPRLKFNKRAAADLLNEAVNSLKTAKSRHDELESFYIAAADFEGIDRLARSLTDEIRRAAER